LSDTQVRELLASNQTARSIFSANLKKRLETETQKLKDEQAGKINAETQKLKEEHEKVIADAQQKAETAQAQAVLMMEKKSSLRLNMAENRSKTAQAKLEVVEKAATETPEKPVGEVWEVAKVAKAPAAPPAAVAGMLL
jgi:nucleoprotein TPR